MRTLVAAVGGLQFAQFKMDFVVKKTRDAQTDWHTLRIWNLASPTLSQIANKAAVRIDAGLAGNVGVVGEGFVEHINNRRTGNDRVATIRFAGTVAEEASEPILAGSVANSDVPARDVFIFYARHFDRKIEGLELLDNTTFAGAFNPGPLTPRAGMDRALDRIRIVSRGHLDLTYDIEATRIVLLDRKAQSERTILSVAPQTGLISSPRNIKLDANTEGLEIDVVLDPRVRIDGLIDLQSRFANTGLYRVEAF